MTLFLDERCTALYNGLFSNRKFPDNWYFCWLTVVQRGCQLSGYDCNWTYVSQNGTSCGIKVRSQKGFELDKVIVIIFSGVVRGSALAGIEVKGLVVTVDNFARQVGITVNKLATWCFFSIVQCVSKTLILRARLILWPKSSAFFVQYAELVTTYRTSLTSSSRIWFSFGSRADKQVGECQFWVLGFEAIVIVYVQHGLN